MYEESISYSLSVSCLEVIENNGLVTSTEKSLDDVTSNIPRTPGDENG